MINSANTEFGITHDSELAYVLSKFNNDFIYITVLESLNNKLRCYESYLPNIVASFEQKLKVISSEYPDANNQIADVRNEVYSQIIRLLCDNYRLAFNDNDEFDKYTSAYYMYSLLVSDFQQNLISFFTNFIIKEKSSIYEMLKLSEARKNKDSSTVYAKKIFKNPKLGIISANLDLVLLSICNTFNIDLNTYIEYIYIGDNKMIGKHLQTILFDTDNFMKNYIAPCFNGPFRSVLITSIRLALQKYSNDTDISASDFVKE